MAIPPIILAHDYLIQMGGAERVVAAMARHHPEAPIYTSAMKVRGAAPEFALNRIRTTWMQRLPGMPGRFKHYFPFYPTAFRSFGRVKCEVAWISSSTFSKCLTLAPSAVSVCYCHNPTRFLWQTDEYLDGEVRSRSANQLARLTFPWMRVTDRKAAQRMDIIIANSQTVRQRIRATYGREARVVHPPVEISRFEVAETCGDYHLIVSRLLSYKKIDRAVEAFSKLGKPLVIVGEGPDRARLESMAGPTIRFVGRLSDGKVRSLMECCRGLVLPGEEDFGITPVEAQAAGKPVIAWARGGALETVKEGETGAFFHEGTPDALADAVLRSEKMVWQPQHIRKWAETFSEERYHEEMDTILEEARTEHRARQNTRVKTRRVQWSEDFAASPSFSASNRDALEPADSMP